MIFQLGTVNAQPFLIAELVGFITGEKLYTPGQAYGIAAIVFCMAVINVATNTALFHKCYVLGMRLRVAMGTRIYRKVCLLKQINYHYLYILYRLF